MIATQNSLWIEEDEDDEVPYIVEEDCREYEENSISVEGLVHVFRRWFQDDV